MKLLGLLAIALLTISCQTEKHYFEKALSDADKIYLTNNDTLIKNFSGKSNWYRQYWTGNLSVRKVGKGYDINQIGEWRQTSDDGSELWTITNFDKFGYVVDEKILGDEGMPPTGETHCDKDTVNGQIRLMCDVINRYSNGQIKERGQRVIIKGKATKEGKWEYYTETGTLDRTVNYISDKAVR